MLSAVLVVSVLIPADSVMVEEGGGMLTQGLAVVAASVALAVPYKLRAFLSPSICWCLFGLLAWVTLSTYSVTGRGNVRYGVNELWTWIGGGMLLLASGASWSNSTLHRAAIAWMIALCVSLAGHAWWQHGVELPELQRHYLADPDAAAREAGIHSPAGSRERQILADRVLSTEPFGTFALTNSLAALLLIGLVLGIAQLFPFHPQGMSIEAKTVLLLTRCGFGLSSLTIGYALMLTKSRTAIVALGVSIAWLILQSLRTRSRNQPNAPAKGSDANSKDLRWSQRARWMSLGVCGIAGLAIAWKFGLVDLRVFSEAPLSIRFRLDYWRGALEVIANHPWLGAGPGNFRDAYTLVRSVTANELVADPHNGLLEIASTAGIPALALALCLGYFVLRKVMRESQEVAVARSNPVSVVGIDVGIVLGILGTWSIGLGMGIAPELDPYLVLIPIAVCIRIVLHPWIVYGRVAPWTVPGIVVACGVNLLGSGGLTVPGLLFPFCLLVGGAGMAPSVELVRRIRHRGAGDIPSAWFRRSICFVIVVLFVVTVWYPIRSAASSMKDGQRVAMYGQLSEARQLLLAAAKSDPWDSGPYRLLATFVAGRLLEENSDVHRKELKDLSAAASRRDPESPAMARWLGDMWLSAYQKWGHTNDLQTASAWYERSCQKHPTDAGGWAQWAEVTSELGNVDRAKEFARKAWEIQDLSPWQDLSKLSLLVARKSEIVDEVPLRVWGSELPAVAGVNAGSMREPQ
jgi:hypothetical protein